MKMQINAGELQDWMRDTWQVYASQYTRGSLLRFWVNGLSEYRVIFGEDILYEGSQMTHAIAAWDSI